MGAMRRPVAEGELVRYGDVFAFGPHLSMFVRFEKDGYWVGLTLTDASPHVSRRQRFDYVYSDPVVPSANGRRWERVL